MSSDALERQAIRELVENWALWRDAGDWERFRTVWHSDGRMMATWFQGTADQFIGVSREGFEKGVSILHFLGGGSIDIANSRAIAQTKMTISQRGRVHDVLVDVVCTGRFYDFFEKRDGRWGLVLRQPIYEKDRMDPVDPSVRITLDAALLARFPEGYRHLAYLQTAIGFTVKPDMPGLRGAEVEALYARGAAWLVGKSLRAEPRPVYAQGCQNPTRNEETPPWSR
jgi:SnoaL-like protein